ncbi:methyl-accepting chemotaxis protein [Paludibacterium yongneupense]|uniref:methyl-accepting chemotaxis protein n=1 Tax=Paludibacterium yongneupense TaxID=400061 RepID=UPI00040FE901|nr:methyl-accepting chemotaxis protein [Paludibacterium yongneupense]
MPARFTIKLRIAVLLALSIFSFFAVGALGISRLLQVQQQLRFIDEVSLNAVDLSRRMNTELIEMRLRVVRHKAVTVLPAKLQAEKELKQHADALLALVDSYDKLPVSEGDRQRVESLRGLVGEYLSAAEPILALSRQMDPNHPPPNADPRSAAVAKQVDATVNDIVATTRASATAKRAQAEDAYASARNLLIGLIAGGALLELVVGLYLMRSVTRPLDAVRLSMGTIAEKLDFTHRTRLGGNDELTDTARAFDHLIETLHGSFSELGRAVAGVSESSRAMSGTSADMAASSSGTADASARIASTVEQLTVSISHVGDRAHEASELTQDAGRLARDGEKAILETVQRIEHVVEVVQLASKDVNALRDQAAAIGAVTNVIKDIADQTNLLALNAAIEAARAGEQGRGFAVVADEVRNLAARTAHATLEIDTMIQAVQSGAMQAVGRIDVVVADVTDSAESATGAGGTIVQIRSRTDEAVTLVADIAMTIGEQAAASTTIAQQIEQIAQMSEENHAVAGTAAESATRLAALAGGMHQAMERYRV